MTNVNQRIKRLFIDRNREDPRPIQRNFTFDESTYVALLLESLVQRNAVPSRTFRVSDALSLVFEEYPDTKDRGQYIRPMLEFLQSQVNVGLLTEITPPAIGGTKSDQRQFAAGSTRSIDEWARGTAIASLGLPYAAHIFSDISVRVHRGSDHASPIASGVVIGRDWVVTNAHVVQGSEEVCISWDSSPMVKAEEVICSEELDLAAIHVLGFDSYPIAWLRRPTPAEPVIILAYPEVPQIKSRPLLKFNGWIATTNPVETFFGGDQIIVSAVMGPGASGGPIFAADGCMVALVVQTLEGKHLAEDGHIMQSTFHAALPADLVLEELRRLDPRLALLGKWG